MEPYRRPEKADQAHDEEANTDEQKQDQSCEPVYYSAQHGYHYQYHSHHYYPYPPPPPPNRYHYDQYHYPPHYRYHPAPPVPSPQAQAWHPRPSRPVAAVPVTDEIKHRQDNVEDDRKRPAIITSRNESEGSRKLDPYEPIPWNVAQAQPTLVKSEEQARANRELPDESKKRPFPTLKSPPEDQPAYRPEDQPAYRYDIREAGSFSPIEMSSTHLAGSQYEKADSIWDIRFKELAAFKLKHGHCNVPQKYPPNKSLGIWVNKQRMEYNKRIDGKKKSSLNDSRLEQLQSLGFRWAKRKGEASWENHYASLVAYKKEFGHCSVPTKYKEDTALGRWVSTQRSEYKKHTEGEPTTMTDDKIRRLEKLGFAWWMGA
eukprot:CAMPEP_0201685390 /NCGR_PEP_ID=MMETSP0578-20130828/118_1 /ASSEMBLY_ACC=CAM_ASM_000663 /TAXON_ID=267565 /ORGANISM="Skeletonema grethea, Strain CCMP 1804" /LENGTH=372 /DNA_ID=CAMNT_0048169255 /DNA_START=110 /DNA_END=1228 /DNA_ORIENTATION=-